MHCWGSVHGAAVGRRSLRDIHLTGSKITSCHGVKAHSNAACATWHCAGNVRMLDPGGLFGFERNLRSGVEMGSKTPDSNCYFCRMLLCWRLSICQGDVAWQAAHCAGRQKRVLGELLDTLVPPPQHFLVVHGRTCTVGGRRTAVLLVCMCAASFLMHLSGLYRGMTDT